MCLIASGVNRSNVDDLFPGGVGKTSPRKTKQAERNQDHPQRLVHGASFGGGSYGAPQNTGGKLWLQKQGARTLAPPSDCHCITRASIAMLIPRPEPERVQRLLSTAPFQALPGLRHLVLPAQEALA